ncbi:MAG: hypothetical protein H0V18_13635 [Pyrinomonadaceae bacterium]|nr:hypothetical protein [Pyrinomonadaceae bacterium]
MHARKRDSKAPGPRSLFRPKRGSTQSERRGEYANGAIVFGSTLMAQLADAARSFFLAGEVERKVIEQAVGTITGELLGPVGSELT